MPAFFGVEARPGRRTPYVPPPEEMRLHLTGATLGADPRKGERVVLKVRVSEGGREVFVCSFRGGGQEHCPLDLVLDEYAEFSIEGACSWPPPRKEQTKTSRPPSLTRTLRTTRSPFRGSAPSVAPVRCSRISSGGGTYGVRRPGRASTPKNAGIASPLAAAPRPPPPAPRPLP